MQILARAGWPVLCDETRPADASNPRGYYEFEPVKGTLRDASWVDRAAGKAVKVIHALLPGLPSDRRYRVLLMHRDLDEVIASQDALLARMGRTAPPLPRARLAEILDRQLAETRILLSTAACFEWIEVEHARLIREPAREISRIGAFLELDLESGSPLGGEDGGEGKDESTSGLAALVACVDESLHRERAGDPHGPQDGEASGGGGKASRI